MPTIRFNKDYSIDRVQGTKADAKKEGIIIHGKKAKNSGWSYEDFTLEFKKQTYEAEICNGNNKYCDLQIGNIGFGYVSRDSFKIVPINNT